MHKLNGKPIPGTNPIVRFRLNSATTSQNKALMADREFSVWVGDLSSDVDDYNLYRVFNLKYSSIKTAKVILDSSGFSKGYGFVKFGLEDEQKSALYEMNSYIGLGTKPLKICSAVPKPKGSGPSVPPTPTATSIVASAYGAAPTDYSQYYDPSSSYWQNYSAWQGYSGAAGGYEQTGGDASAYYAQQAAGVAAPVESYAATQSYEHHHQELDQELALVDHKFTLDYDKANRETVEMDRNLYDALESSKWLPIELLEVF